MNLQVQLGCEPVEVFGPMPSEVKHHIQVLTVDRKTVVGDTLRSLPDYFTYEPTIQDYCLTSLQQTSLTFVAVTESGIMAGFIIMVQANNATSEIAVIAVRPEWHRHGFGSSLLQEAENHARKHGKEYVVVKTIGPSQNDLLAAQAYSFFLKNNYCPLEEFDSIWQDCYCVIMVKKL